MDLAFARMDLAAAPHRPTERVSARAATTVAVIWTAVLTALVIGPMAGRGWVLTLDWVTGPHTTYADRVLAGSSLPAGPIFFATAAALQWIAGAAVGWLVPATWLVLAGWAGSRIVTAPVAARLAGATAIVWNPFVHERLYAGQMATLAGYAILVALTASVLHPAGPRPWLRWGGWWAASSAASIQFLVIGAIPVVLVPLLAAPAGHRLAALRRSAAAAAVALAVTAAWLLPALGEAPNGGDSSTAAVFATRADPRLGLLAGTLLQRGFWRAAPAAPGVDGGTLPNLLAGAVFVVAACGWWLGRRREPAAAAGLALVAAIGWVLAWGPAGPLGPLHRVAVDHLGGAAAFREAGKFLALVPLVYAFGLAHATTMIGRSRRTTATALVVALVPIGLTPALAWGVGGRLAAVRYPPSWQDAAAVVADAPAASVAVLPFDAYVDPGFTGGRVVTHPAPAFFGPPVVVSDDPAIAGLGGSERTRRIAAALAGPSPRAGLAALGIHQLVITRPDPTFDPARAGFVRTFHRGDLSVWRHP